MKVWGPNRRRPRHRRLFSRFWLSLAAGGAVGVCLLVSGCDPEKPARPPERDEEPKPTLRIYSLAGAAGTIEPCGCVKDMLGGIDHAAALIESGQDAASHSLVVGAGPMFFENPEVGDRVKQQSWFKAQAMAQSLRDLGLTAWAPGANDWAMGRARFSKLAKASGARALAANLGDGAGPVTATHVVTAGSLKVGLVGVSVPSYPGGQFEFSVTDAPEALKKGVSSVKKSGADLVVALIAADRGRALRMVESTHGVQLAVLGKPYDKGEANDEVVSPEVIGKTLVAQAPNHLQGVAVVDLFVRGNDHTFADGSGIEAQASKDALDRRISELERRLVEWKKPDSGVSPGDIGDRQAELTRLQKERAALGEPEPPESGSYFLYELTEVRESFGVEERVASRLVAYYRKVNEHNKKAFADREPPPTPEGESSYVGLTICSSCHLEERAVWDKTSHSGAYETLTADHKEYNLDCVSCHVTGYEKPGGSTVTHVDELTDVQCEVCHGPGSLHVENPADLTLIKKEPDRDFCATTCHHPPHVKPDWNVDEAWPNILGKGHGRDE